METWAYIDILLFSPYEIMEINFIGI